jgi:pimeloyl-ACP methyl ester carboxylesterase
MTTYVLLHGAYQGGWIWKYVAEQLRAAGHLVLTPTMEGCAERAMHVRPGITTETHGEEVAKLLHYEDLRDVVLVGTSTGGMVLCAAAERARERIGRVVFADALALLDGEALDEIVHRKTAVNTELTSGPPREDIATRLFGNFEPALRDWALDRTTMHPIAAMTGRISLPTFWNTPWKASVIWCHQSENPPRSHQERTRDKLGAKWMELDTGHYPMLTTPRELAGMIMAE